MAKFHIIIPAAGSGSRMGLDKPKQYLVLHKQTFVERVTRVFENISFIDSIHIALHPEDGVWKTLNLSFRPRFRFIIAGELREVKLFLMPWKV